MGGEGGRYGNLKTPPLPLWLDRQLTAESAKEMLSTLVASPPRVHPTGSTADAALADAQEEDAHAKRFALLVFAYGGGRPQREHCANADFAAAVAKVIDHPTPNVRSLAIETMGALASFDESLVLPHVPRIMARLHNPNDALAVLSILRADLLPKVREGFLLLLVRPRGGKKRGPNKTTL